MMMANEDANFHKLIVSLNKSFSSVFTRARPGWDTICGGGGNDDISFPKDLGSPS